MKNRIFSGLGIAGIVLLCSAAGCVYIATTQKNPVAGMLGAFLLYIGSDMMMFEISYAWTNGGLKERFEHWQKRRYWNKTRQLDHLRLMIQSDLHWMNHDATAKKLCERYSQALEENWYSFSFPHSSVIRRELKLDPISDAITHVLVVSCDDMIMRTALMIPAQWPNRDLEGIAYHMFNTYKEMTCVADESLRHKEWSYAIAKLHKL